MIINLGGGGGREDEYMCGGGVLGGGEGAGGGVTTKPLVRGELGEEGVIRVIRMWSR